MDSENKKAESYWRTLASISSMKTEGFTFKMALEQVLPFAVRFCKGKTIYSIHFLKGDHISYRWCGPSGSEHHRRNGTKSLPITKGIIGYTLRNNKQYQICNNFQKDEYFSEIYEDNNNKFAKSELVVVIYNPIKPANYDILNFESDDENAFDEVDAGFFWTIGMWASISTRKKSTNTPPTKLIKMFSQAAGLKRIILQEHGFMKAPNVFVESFINFCKEILPFTAVSIIAFRKDGDNFVFNIIGHHGHDIDRLEKRGFRDDTKSFSSVVFAQSSILIANEEEHLPLLKKYRKETKSAIGIRLPSLQPSYINFAVILEFDEENNFAQDQIDNAKHLSHLISSFYLQNERNKELGNLKTTFSNILKESTNSSSPFAYQILLENTAKVITNCLHSTVCGIFEFDYKDSSNKQLKRICMYVDESQDVEKDAIWINWLRNNWESKMELYNRLKHTKELDISLSIPPSEKHMPGKYRLYIRKIDIQGKELYIASFKSLENFRWDIMEMSQMSKDSLSIILNLLNIYAQNLEQKEKHEIFKKGMSTSLRHLFTRATSSVQSKEEKLAALLDEAHRFLADVPVNFDNQFSAIFLRDKAGKILEIHNSSKTFLKKMMEQIGRGEFIDQLEPLRLPIRKDSGSKKEGLTTKVFVSREPVYSTNVDWYGTPECQNFWETVTGYPPSQRYFAGVPIKGSQTESNTNYYGVLTLNGRALFDQFKDPVERDWRLTSLLMALAAEIGYAIDRFGLD